MAEWNEVPSDDWVGHTQSDDAAVVRGLLGPIMLQALEPKGKSILDLGCGEGYFARTIKAAGAVHSAGLDISPDFIKTAQARDPQGEYHVQDIQTGSFFGPERFDAMSAFMVLMYMRDLDAAYRNIAKMLRPGGRLVASITNPYYSVPAGSWRWTFNPGSYQHVDPRRRTWKMIARQIEAVLRGQFQYMLHIKNYFETRVVTKQLTGADVMHLHRPFSEYLNFAKKNGLELEVMLEPRITPELLARYPDEPVARALADVPVLLVLVFTKA
jgi:2-polyprenyl-3-methyl-5-hydroxy-6-metoxy-1,4-benzoquinol methylase